ncbi:MAG: bifunctional DNA primase/polymerase [Actinomycetota bacterium]|nr:bifunctional DNA primase/polymerase [Actinomycetota bacterium]
MSMLEHALRYARSGLAVLPLAWPASGGCSCRRPDCASPAKHPLKHREDLEHGKDDATSDMTTVATWWKRWRDANIGIRPPAGVVVLDVDPRHGGDVALLELTRQHRPLPETLTARTGSGGLHIWLSYAGPARGRLCRGVDVKTHGGYLVVPPSLHVCGGRYEWLNEVPAAPAPGWVRQLLSPPSPRTNTTSSRSSTSGAAADGLVRVVASAAEGNRNRMLHWAACRAHERGGDPGLLAELARAAEGNGLTRVEVERTLGSAARTARGGAA